MAIPRLSKVAVTLLLFIIKSYAFQSVKVPKQGRLRLSSTTENTQNDVIEELISSNEIQNVFTLLMRNPTISLSPEQSTLLLNNLNVLAKISSGNDVSKFYQRLQKAGKAIPSFGTMVLDGPLSELTLPKFEVLMTVDPTFLQTATELKESSYSSLLIPNELGVMASAARSSLEIRIKLQIALLFGFMDLGYQLSISGSSHDALVNVALTFGITAGLLALESPLFLNGEISRRVGWLKSAILQKFNPSEKKREYRSNAATFLVAYMLGTPIQEFDLDSGSENARKRFRYPDAPKIDMRDPAMSVLEQTGQIDLIGLKRLATVQMTNAAMDAIDGGATPKIADYSKILLAALAQRGANPLYSTITNEEFPNRLVPTLARYGFVEAVMIIRENGAAISALVEVFESGGGVGDAILAIENTVSKNQELAVTTRRNRRLKIEADLLQKDYSTFNAIVAINNAKSVSTPTVDTVLTDEIELIPGTTRIHTRSELILPTNPSVAQVKTLARDIMNNKLQADKIYYGKVSERTKKEIAVLYEQVSCALRIYENSPEAVLGYERDFESPPLSKGEDQFPETLKNSRAFMRDMMVQEEKENLLHQIGLSEKKLNHLKPLPAIMQDLNLIGETLIQLNKLKDSYWNNYYNIEALWVFRGSVYFERLSGLSSMNAVDAVWDAIGLSTRTPKGLAKEDKSNISMGGGKLNRETIKDLSDLVGRIGFQPPSGAPSEVFNQPVGSVSTLNTVMTEERNGSGEKDISEELRGVKMIPVSNDDFTLLSKETINRNHLQRRKSLLASRSLPLLKDLLFVKNNVEKKEEKEVVEKKEVVLEMASTNIRNVHIDINENEDENEMKMSAVDMKLMSGDRTISEETSDIEVEVKDEDETDDEDMPNLSAPLLMIRSNIGASYHQLNENIKKLNIDNIKKIKRIRELEDLLN